MKIIIWTKSIPKIEAIKSWVEKCVYFKWQQVEIIPLKVDSWISEMPTSVEENMLWAKNRSLNSKKEMQWNLYIGMEWWTQIIENKAYLFWVVYILNNDWEWHYGFSNMMEIPEVFKKWIYEENKELSNIMSELTWTQKKEQLTWSFWVWSDNMLTRTMQFELAFLSAISPFYNDFYKTTMMNLNNSHTKKYHKTRQMFCLHEWKLFIAQKWVDYWHYDWFKKLWIMNNNNSFEIIQNTLRWYLNEEWNIYFYIWENFETNNNLKKEFLKHLKELIEKTNLKKDWKIYAWFTIWKPWEERKPKEEIWIINDYLIN